MCLNVLYVAMIMMASGWQPDPDLKTWRITLIRGYMPIIHYRVELKTEGECVIGLRRVPLRPVYV